ncbi:MAG: hypothetical protein K9K21_01890 [Desulfotignum sp.]|nr:hypothetical protein [Desulfotignum sp.]MCF8112584.1 hypothetical protein [Desulfotignum sp.]MCF8124976.1 hypothetical protein [Desulfotignum sp.]
MPLNSFKSIYFDQRDHDLIKIVNSVYDTDARLGYIRKLYYPFFHPLGIKELAESKGLHLAYAIVNLLESMERGVIENRLAALKALKDEVLDTAGGPMPKNTARVLLQIMKELVRAKGKKTRQLELAHTFRMAAFGKPREIRRLLAHYHLLEMPEAWNQITFDDHVHDANTSGRKSPTHLIMDAWIKGIRRLRVIYYHYIEPRFVLELIEAAGIMEIDLRIGIEFKARYRDRFISFIWVSRGLADAESFLCFLADPHVEQFMKQGKAVLKFQEKYVLDLLKKFNEHRLNDMCQYLDIQMAPLCPDKFLAFSFPGQPSTPHLAEYIHAMAVQAMVQRTDQLQEEFTRSDAKRQEDIKNQIKTMDCFSVKEIIDTYLNFERHPDIFQTLAADNDPDIPEQLKLTHTRFFETIGQLHYDFRITLKLDNLLPEDVLEILYEAKGLITRLEIINLKDFVSGKTDHIFAVNELQKALNQGSLIKLKSTVRQIISCVEQAGYTDISNRRQKLYNILYDIDDLKNMYRSYPLKSRIGSDSTGKAHQAYGMGFGIVHTLPFRAIRNIRTTKKDRLILPANIRVNQRMTAFSTADVNPVFRWILAVLKWLPGLDQIRFVKKKEWVFESFALDMKKSGNIVTLGGIQRQNRNGLGLLDHLSGIRETPSFKSWKNLNTKFKNCLKIGLGFIPAFVCFFLTKEWWFLAWFGAFIWFGITGFRVILQSVLGGGGIKRSSLTKWNNYVSWDRFTDALLFTGFSVPLLDFLVKTLLLDNTLGINMNTSPVALYSVMGLANGIYLSAHNAFRGLPKGMVTGNFFRSILSIPVALLFNAIIGVILVFFNVPAIETVLQKWAAIISKAASDTVAGIIEGTVDRFQNLKLRQRDVKKKFSDLFDTYARLEMLFPDTQELKILIKPESLFSSRNSEVRDLAVLIIINALDLFYFWMYLPRARMTILEMVSCLTPEEKTIFFQSQKLLEQEQHISRLFVDGILGSQFSRPLSFYLTAHQKYLASIHKIESIHADHEIICTNQ